LDRSFNAALPPLAQQIDGDSGESGRDLREPHGLGTIRARRAIRTASLGNVDEQDRHGLGERAKIGSVAKVAAGVLREAARQAGVPESGERSRS
jgi:hypothetical protein